MRIDLIRIGIADAQKLWKMQVEGFEDFHILCIYTLCNDCDYDIIYT